MELHALNAHGAADRKGTDLFAVLSPRINS